MVKLLLMKPNRVFPIRIIFFSFLLFFSLQKTFCQNSSAIVVDKDSQKKEPTTSLDGYFKMLPSIIAFTNSDNYYLDILFHNRLNFSWFPNDKFTFKASLRNRLFLGDQIRSTSNFSDLVDSGANDYFNLSSKLINSKGLLFHSYFDRFYGEYSSGQWEVRLGRQRINWGIATIWNPNDIFNAYAFTDFDYEERPGSDALRIKKYIGYSGSIELAFSPADTFNQSTAALLYKFNKYNYDFQLLSGVVNQDFVFGVGWAGNIKTAGFKTEMSYFFPLIEGRKAAYSAAINFDYALAFGLYFNVGVLYNSAGGLDQGFNDLFNVNLSARNLYPYRWSTMFSAGSPLSPIMSASLTAVYSPVKSNALFLLPTYTISVATNWDLDFVMQILFEGDQGKYSSPLQAYFVRTKWSF